MRLNPRANRRNPAVLSPVTLSIPPSHLLPLLLPLRSPSIIIRRRLLPRLPTPRSQDLAKVPAVPITHLRSAVGPDGRVAALSAETSTAAPEAIARAALEKAVGSAEEWTVVSSYDTKHTGTRHVTLRQKVSGLDCANCIAVCNIAKDGRVLNLAFTAHVGRHPRTAPTVRDTAVAPLPCVFPLHLNAVTVPVAAVRSVPAPFLLRPHNMDYPPKRWL